MGDSGLHWKSLQAAILDLNPGGNVHVAAVLGTMGRRQDSCE